MARDAGWRAGAGRGRIVADAAARRLYVRPTLLDDVPPTTRWRRRRSSARCRSRSRSTDEADAIRIANGTAYGLVAGVWTRDGGRQMRMARALRAGQVFVNNYGAGGGVELPFGGVKALGPRPREGLRGAVRLLDREDHRAPPRLTRVGQRRQYGGAEDVAATCVNDAEPKEAE